MDICCEKFEIDLREGAIVMDAQDAAKIHVVDDAGRIVMHGITHCPRCGVEVGE